MCLTGMYVFDRPRTLRSWHCCRFSRRWVPEAFTHDLTDMNDQLLTNGYRGCSGSEQDKVGMEVRHRQVASFGGSDLPTRSVQAFRQSLPLHCLWVGYCEGFEEHLRCPEGSPARPCCLQTSRARTRGLRGSQAHWKMGTNPCSVKSL